MLDERLARALRGFGAVGLFAIALILSGNLLFIPLSALLALAWAWASATPWRELGFVRPRSWIASIVLGIAFGALFKLAMKAIVMPLLGAPAVNARYHFLAGNTTLKAHASRYGMWGGSGFVRQYIVGETVPEAIGAAKSTNA